MFTIVLGIINMGRVLWNGDGLIAVYDAVFMTCNVGMVAVHEICI